MPIQTRPAVPEEADVSAVAFRTFLAVAERLGLPVRDRLALLGIAKSTYTVWLRWKGGNCLAVLDGGAVRSCALREVLALRWDGERLG